MKVPLSSLGSPYAPALISVLVFAMALLFPPKVYSELMFEPSLVFCNGLVLVFFGLCTLFFLIGCRFGNAGPAKQAFIQADSQPSALVNFALIGTGLLHLLSFALLIAANPLILGFLFVGEGAAMKEELATAAPLAQSSTVHMVTVWWALYRYRHLRLMGLQRPSVKWLLVVSVILFLALESVKLARFEILPFVVGVSCILSATSKRRINAVGIAAGGLAILATLILIFWAFAWLRGYDDWQSGAASLVGYTVASYNRLAFALQGQLKVPYNNFGLYTFPFIGFSGLLNGVLPLAEFLRWPSYVEAWRSEFSGVWSAGLNGDYIWPSAMGYAFYDMAWFAPIYFLLCGGFTGWAWKLFSRGKTLGVIFYPWAVSSIAFWCGPNTMFDLRIVVVFMVAVLLRVLERFAK